MSQYEYYEFQAVDRRLGENDMRALRSCSSRAQITPVSFTNEYHFGSFKGNTDRWMEQYFDGFIYNSNWGTRVLMIALPAKILSLATASLYCYGDSSSAWEKDGKVILKYMWHEEDYEKWVVNQEALSPLLALRQQLSQGDLRSLYVGWLLSVQSGKCKEDQVEPPVPANLGDLSDALRAMVNFLQIDPDLLAVAAEASPSSKSVPIERAALAAWITTLPASAKDELLMKLLEGESAQAAMELRARFCQSYEVHMTPTSSRCRTVRELLSTAEAFRARRRRDEARAAEAESQRQQALAAQARKRHLESLVGREASVWAKVEEFIATKQSKKYDEAVQHLIDLRDLAAERTNQSEFQKQVIILRSAHAAKKSLLDRMQRGGL
jgi:hypothetical protein